MKTINKKIILFGIGFFITIAKVFSKNQTQITPILNLDDDKFFPLNGTNKFRECDAFGCGYYGANRGNRTHKGLDIEVFENQTIQAPFDCKIIRYGYPYANDTNYRLVEIQGLNNFINYTAKIMYIKKIYSIGEIINKGSTLCSADNISSKYGTGMTNHIHFELYKNGISVDPTPYF